MTQGIFPRFVREIDKKLVLSPIGVLRYYCRHEPHRVSRKGLSVFLLFPRGDADACSRLLRRRRGEVLIGYPHIELGRNFRLLRTQIKEIEQIIEEHYDELKRAWEKHFPG
jgi:hypothetical protein